MSTEQDLASFLQETNLLKCPSCEKNVTDPVILPCLDTLCQGCYDNVQKQQESGRGCPVCIRRVQGQTDNTAKGQITCLEGVQAHQNYFMKSLKELSDCKNPDVKKLCASCQFDQKSHVASSRCLECGDNLCEDCVSVHRKTKVTRGHKVISLDQIQHGEYDTAIRQHQSLPCTHHPGEPIKYFCHRCDALICRECRVSQHADHSCVESSTAASRFITQNASLVNTLKDKAEKLEQLEGFLEDYNAHVEQSKVEVIREIEFKAEKLHKMVEEYRASMIEQVMPTVLDEQARNGEKIQQVQGQRQMLEDSGSYIQNLFQHGKPEEILDTRDIIKSRLSELAHLQTEPITSQLNLKFRHGVRTLGANEAVFGKVEVYHSPLNEDSVHEISGSEEFSLSCVMPTLGESVKLVGEFECRGLADTKDIWPSGVAVDITGNLLIVDRENKRVKMFDRDGKLLREFGQAGTGVLKAPYDLTVLLNGNIAVTDYEDESVKIFTHTGQFVTSWKDIFKHPRGITTDTDGQVVVVDCNKKRVTVHDPETGALVAQIHGKSPDRCDLFNDPYYVTITPSNHTVVTDWIAPNIKLFDEEKQYLSKYGTYGVNKERVLQPYGVCTDSFGYIFVADNQNNRIHLLDPSGKFVRFLLHEKHGLWHPMALVVNQEGHLVVTEALGKVKIFKYL